MPITPLNIDFSQLASSSDALKNMEFFLGTATILSGLSTVVIAVLTYFLWLENRRLRKAGSEPSVIAHFDIHPSGGGAINLSLSNVGTGPALDVSFHIKASQKLFEDRSVLIDINQKRTPLTLIAQGEKLSFLFGISFKLFKKDKEISPIDPFEVIVQWKDSTRKKAFNQSYTLDISQYSGLAGMLSKPPTYKIADSLKSIDKHLSNISGWPHSTVDLVDATKPEDSIRALLVTKHPF